MFGLGKKVYPVQMPDERQMFNMNREATAQNRRIAALTSREANIRAIRSMSNDIMFGHKGRKIAMVTDSQGESFYPATDAVSLGHIARADKQRIREADETRAMGAEDKPPSSKAPAPAIIKAALNMQRRRRSSVVAMN